MMSDAAYKLHDRATRGETLTPAEQTTLDAWYARMDAEESARLSNARKRPDTDNLALLREKVVQAEAQAIRLLQANQEAATRNETLRAEIEQMKARLSRLPTIVP
jgi:hypothetical protein